MGRQWRTQYPLSERTVKVLRPARWFHAAFAVLVIAALLLTLTAEDTGWRDWHLWSDAVGTVPFPGFFLLTTHQLRRNDAFLHGRQPTS